MILVVGRRNPSASDWSIWVNAFSGATRTHAVRTLLVVSHGGGPNARQRKQVAAALMEALDTDLLRFRTAVCGDLPLVRAITAAIGWLAGAGSQHLKSFRLDQRREALAFLSVPETRHPEILQTVQRLERELDPCR